MRKTIWIVAVLAVSAAHGGALFVATIPGIALAQARNAPVLLTPAFRLIGQEDYPSAAVRDGREGSTGVELVVGIDGRVHGCRVTQSSGHADLDAATCAALQKRATFRPPGDAAGRPIAGAYSTRIRWALPQEPVQPATLQSPSRADGGSGKVAKLIVYGNDPCPQSSGGQIIECVRREASDRYKISAQDIENSRLAEERRREAEAARLAEERRSASRSGSGGGLFGALLKRAVQGAVTGYAVKKGALPPSAIYGAGRDQAFSSGQSGNLSGGGITGSCKADQDALIARMNRLQNSPPAGICANAHASHPIHVDMANFYARCPSADPSGQMRQMALDGIRTTKQQMEQTCSR